MPVPIESAALATWFAEGVLSEIEALKKSGNSQKYELLSGKFDDPANSIFRFVIADGMNIPEEAAGELEIGDIKLKATVLRQQNNLIYLRLEGNHIPSEGIRRAILTIDDTMLLQRLAEVLQEKSKAPSPIGPLAGVVFHPHLANVGTAVLPPTRVSITGLNRTIIEKACGSSLTYIWGPPGTGKTYTIAGLIASLVDLGERVLVTSHTNAAVDQALYETIKDDGPEPGPLAKSNLLSEYKLLRIGMKVADKISPVARLSKAVELKTEEMNNEILTLEMKAKPLFERRSILKGNIVEWSRFDELTKKSSEMQSHVLNSQKHLGIANRALVSSQRFVEAKKTELEQAKAAWLFRSSRTAKAVFAVEEAERSFIAASEQVSVAQGKYESLLASLDLIGGEIQKQKETCRHISSKDTLERELSMVEVELKPSEERICQLHEMKSQVEKELLNNASAIFGTLTKCYLGKEIGGQNFDAVIIDEVSMALPPLVFLAASIASRRVIVVGDFLQLSPVVRSDSDISNERLKIDTFHLAGIAREFVPVTTSKVLQKLSIQRRMLPEISAVANYLVYASAKNRLEDHSSTIGRTVPPWLSFLPSNPLVIVDTADLHSWCGKQAGSLSRFNFYSAVVAISIASMAASHILKPEKDASKPIGIVTPYAAQRRLLVRLVNEMGLEDWVVAGTVHTFQGGEAEMIIFDTVLDEPYWSARLCTPRAANDVKRDLNVAVTRAKSKFIFLGSSEWMNRHARPGSALGDMWAYLKDRADLHSAVDIVETPLRGLRLSIDTAASDGTWRFPISNGMPTHDILDEVAFFGRFLEDIQSASREIFGLVPFFGEYRWPRVQPSISNALQRGIAITLVTPPLAEVRENRGYVESAIKNLRDLGAIVVHASGLHGKEIVIDERIHYVGSLNWASHRGNNEIMHRIESEEWTKTASKFLQTRYIRRAAVYDNGELRSCPNCGGATHVINQQRQHGAWDNQALKIGCSNPACNSYLRSIDERPPFTEAPRCQIDGVTKCRKVVRGKGSIWQCPKHPRECKSVKVVPGDP